ncbi:MAG: hypothetical protein ABIW82_07730 [Dokdonella sp.]
MRRHASRRPDAPTIWCTLVTRIGTAHGVDADEANGNAVTFVFDVVGNQRNFGP